MLLDGTVLIFLASHPKSSKLFEVVTVHNYNAKVIGTSTHQIISNKLEPYHFQFFSQCEFDIILF